jgi:hypothetical protein
MSVQVTGVSKIARGWKACVIEDSKALSLLVFWFPSFPASKR